MAARDREVKKFYDVLKLIRGRQENCVARIHVDVKYSLTLRTSSGQALFYKLMNLHEKSRENKTFSC